MVELKKFPNIRKFAWKSTKEQRWNTIVKQSGSGHIRTMSTWRYPQWTITATYAHLTAEEYREIMGFFASLKGGAIPFLWLDPEDYQERGVVLGRGSAGSWTPVHRFGEFVEPVPHIEDLKLYADGKQVTAKYENGVIRASGSVPADAVITADYTYYWKTRLADSKITAEVVFVNFFKTKTMKLITVR